MATVLKAIIDKYLPEWFGAPKAISGDSLKDLATQLFSVQGNIIAHPGGGQANATPLLAAFNDVTTVATAGDSVLLPYAIPGTTVQVVNSGTAFMQMWARANNPHNGGLQDMISVQGTNTTVTNDSFGNGVLVGFICFRPGLWRRNV